MPNHSPLITVMSAAAEKAGRAVMRDFGEVEKLQVSRKGPADFVSKADHKVEEMLQYELSKARPKFGFLMEERGAVNEGADQRWIVDPIDGTTNFLHGLPHWAISIAVEQDGQLVAGLIHDPIKAETFWAERNRGAWLNDYRLRVSGRKQLADCVFATGIPFLGIPGHQRFVGELSRVMAVSAGVRRFGSAALDLAYTAAGRFDGFWEEGLQAWDVAAGLIILREAGGIVTTRDNAPDCLHARSLVAGNPDTHRALLKLLKGD